MTIRKGEAWGVLTVPDDKLVTVASDGELRELIGTSRAAQRQLPVVGLLGGDLMRTIGGSGDRSRFTGDEPVPHLPVDIVGLIVDGERETIFVAHLVARRSWWRGPITAAMNAQFLGSWDVAPRCHPNDGRVDIVSASVDLTLQQRWQARSRLPLGTHVPHPLISIRQQATASIELGSTMPLYVDGKRWGSGRHLELTVQPDALVVCV